MGGALYRHVILMLSAANPATRLPWIGWPAERPKGVKALNYLAALATTFSMVCVSDALGQRHLYDILWGLPLALLATVMATVAQAQHNRRVRGAA